jgi:hypothetical protein
MVVAIKEREVADRRPVQVYMALSPLGLALWSTVRYPTEDNVIVVRHRSNDETKEKS